jgi:DNA-binding PadR family transcriptional regulator
MSLEHAILGFLNLEPMSGYDLKKSFDNSVRHFWPADQSQIYRTLAQLAEAGRAEIENVTQEGKPNRKVYHITEAGRQELHSWLNTKLPPDEIREASLIQVFFAGELSDSEIRDLFLHKAEQLKSLLSEYQAIEQLKKMTECEESSEYNRRSYFWMLTLENGITVVKALLEWVENVIERLEKKEHIK